MTKGIQDLRSKLRPVQVQSMEEQDKELDQQLGRSGYTENSERLTIENGRNVFRIYPPHEPEDENGRPNPFAEPKVIVYVPGMVYDRDSSGEVKKNSEGKPIYKEGLKPVFNAKVHGKKDKFGNPLTEDLVEEFNRIANERAKEITDENKRKEYLLPIFGRYSSDSSKRVNGTIYRQTWEMYCDKHKADGTFKFGTLEIGKAVKNRINKIAAIEAANEPLGTDPFTDIDEGRAIVIVYNKDAEKPEDYYTTEIDNSTVVEIVQGRSVKVLKNYPLSDDQIENFFKKDPLAKIYRNVFTRRDFDLQLAGLTMIDRKNKMGIVDSPEFQRIAEHIASFYPEEETKKNEYQLPVITTPPVSEETKVSTSPTPLQDTPTSEQEGDLFDGMSRQDMKDFCKDNSTGILVLPESKQSDEQLRSLLRQWLASREASSSITQTVQQETETTVEVLDPIDQWAKDNPEKVQEEERLQGNPNPEVVLSSRERLELLRKKTSQS